MTNRKNIFMLIIINLCVLVYFTVSYTQTPTPPRHPQISPWLVGNNTWMNPGTREWNYAKECPLQSIREGGEAFDGGIPGQLADWKAQAKSMGAQLIIQIPHTFSGDQAANVVRQNPDIIYYNIGNEPGLSGEGPSVVAALIKRCAPAMKAVNPNIKIYVADECDLWYGGRYYEQLFSTTNNANDVSGKTPDGKYWMVDGISWHRYADGDITNDVGQRIRECWELAQRVNQAKGRTGENRLMCGIGEFNHNGGAGVHTFINGQAFGCIYGLCMKYEYTYATMWSMFENGGSRSGTDFSWIDGPTGKPRAMYYHMQMIAQNFSGVYCDGKSNVSTVFTYGSRDQNKLCAMIINKGSSPQQYVVRFNNTDITTGPSCKINIDAEVTPNLDYQDQVPANATHCIVIKNTGSKKIEYTSAHFNAAQPSVTTPINVTWTGPALAGTPVVYDNLIKKNDIIEKSPDFVVKKLINKLDISFSLSDCYEIALVTLNGVLLRKDNINGKQALFNIDNISKGVYLLRLTGKSKIYSTKVFIE